MFVPETVMDWGVCVCVCKRVLHLQDELDIEKETQVCGCLHGGGGPEVESRRICVLS